jgi:hypothetical protein
VRAGGSGSEAAGPELLPVSVIERGAEVVVEAGSHRLTLARLLPSEVSGRETLTVTWDGRQAVVAAVR